MRLELEAFREARKSAESPAPPSTPAEDSGGLREATQRPWWRRMLRN